MNGLIMDEMVKNLAKVGEAHAKTGELLEESLAEKVKDSKFYATSDDMKAGTEPMLDEVRVWIDKAKKEKSILVGIKERLGAGVFDYENLLNKLLENINELELVPEFEPETHVEKPFNTGHLRDLQDLVIVLEKHNRYFDFLLKHLSKLV